MRGTRWDRRRCRGRTLYLPRGWLHEAATSDSDSLHITVGVSVYTWVDAFKAALDDCRDDVEFRRTEYEQGDVAASGWPEEWPAATPEEATEFFEKLVRERT